MTEKPKIIIITGPTASGKTKIAIELALYFNGEIINADSMQVYKEMNIGTAKPTIEQKKMVPHHLIDVVYPDEEFNAAKYENITLPIIYELNSKEKIPFIVGGTGLYIRALLKGLFHVPPVDIKLREKLRKKAEKEGLEILYNKLKKYDPEYAYKIHPHDKIRIIRAIEIYYLSGKKPSELIKEHTLSLKEERFQAITFFLDLKRDQLYNQINYRCLRMLETGLIEETRRLLLKGYSPELKPMQSIGYKHIVKYIKRDWNLETALRVMQRDTRRYAKRQITWFRKERGIVWISPDNITLIKDKISKFLGL